MTSSLWRQSHILEKWRQFFKLYIGLFFDTESQNAQVKLVTSRKRIMTSFKLSIGQKMLWIRKVISENLKNWETFRNRSNFKFSEIISDDIWVFDSEL